MNCVSFWTLMRTNRYWLGLASMAAVSSAILLGCAKGPAPIEPTVSSSEYANLRDSYSKREKELEDLKAEYAKLKGQNSGLEEEFKIDKSVISTLESYQDATKEERDRWNMRLGSLESQRNRYFQRLDFCEQALKANGFDVEQVESGIRNKDGTYRPTEFERVNAQYARDKKEWEISDNNNRRRIAELELKVQRYEPYVPADKR